MEKLEDMAKDYKRILSEKKKEVEENISTIENEINLLKQYNRDTKLLENILKLNKQYYIIFSELYKLNFEKEKE